MTLQTSLLSQLEEICREDDERGPLHELLDRLKDHPVSEQAVAEAYARVLKEEPARLLEQVRQEEEQKLCLLDETQKNESRKPKEKETAAQKSAVKKHEAQRESVSYEERTLRRLKLMSSLLPPGLYRRFQDAQEQEKHRAALENDQRLKAPDPAVRGAVLREVRENLKSMATGKTPRFYRMLNAINRAVETGAPSKKEPGDLIHAIGEYVTTDCAPNSRELDEKCLLEAMRAVKVLLPDKEFESVLESVNRDRVPRILVSDLERKPVEKAPPELERTRELVRETETRHCTHAPGT